MAGVLETQYPSWSGEFGFGAERRHAQAHREGAVSQCEKIIRRYDCATRITFALSTSRLLHRIERAVVLVFSDLCSIHAIHTILGFARPVSRVTSLPIPHGDGTGRWLES